MCSIPLIFVSKFNTFSIAVYCITGPLKPVCRYKKVNATNTWYIQYKDINWNHTNWTAYEFKVYIQTGPPVTGFNKLFEARAGAVLGSNL